jgi:outer membrane protein TolC
MPPEPLRPLLGRETGRIPAAPPKIFVGIPADLLRRSPAVRAAELQAAAQSAQIGVAESDLYPAISLTGVIGGYAATLNGHYLGQVFSAPGLTYSVGPSFQWNILNYGQITNNVRLQDATLQQDLENYKNSVLTAQQNVENGISTYLQSKIEVGELRYSVKAANGALSLSLLEYQEGTRDYTSVLTSEQNLLTAETDLAVAEGNVPLGVAAVYEALGGGWQIREGNDFVPPATNDEMRARTNWGDVLPPAGTPPPTPPALAAPTPGLPGPEDRGPTVRAPAW